MEPIKMNVEDVIKKWEKHHPVPSTPSNQQHEGEAWWYQQSSTSTTDGYTRRRRRRRAGFNDNQV